MKHKILATIFFIFLKDNILSAQAKSVGDTAVLFSIIFVESATIKKYFISSVKLYNSKSFIITDFAKDTFEIKYEYPFCIMNKDVFYHIRDSLFTEQKKYYAIFKLQLDKDVCIKIPYFHLLADNTLIINRKTLNSKKVDCYYTLAPKESDFFPKTIICTGDFIQCFSKWIN